jgi:hypothetical protein
MDLFVWDTPLAGRPGNRTSTGATADPGLATVGPAAVGQFCIARLDAVPPRRHDHRVRSVSEDYGRLRRLDHVLVGADAAERLVLAVCTTTGTPSPTLRFHGRRSPFTGMTEAPRWVVEAMARRRGVSPMPDLGHIPEHGAIRLGRETTLMTVAHELGHHLVHHHDPIGTADHGNRWVRRFDEAARSIDHLMGTAGD